MTGQYLSELRRRAPLVLVGTYAWLLSLSPALSSGRTGWTSAGALAALWFGFLLPSPAARRALSLYGFTLLSGATFLLGDSDSPPMKWFELVGWCGFAAVVATDALPDAELEAGDSRRLQPRRATSRVLLLVPLFFGVLGLGLWALAKPLDSGPKASLLLVGYLAAGMLLLRTGGLMGTAFATPAQAARIPRVQLLRAGVALLLLSIWATRHLLSG